MGNGQSKGFDSRLNRRVEKAAKKLGLSTEKILLGDSSGQPTDKTIPPPESKNFIEQVTEGCRESLEKHGLLEKKGINFLDDNTKKSIAENTLPSDLMSKVKTHIKEIIQEVEGNPEKLDEKQKELIKSFLIADYYHKKARRKIKPYMRHDSKKFITGLENVKENLMGNKIVHSEILGVTKDFSGKTKIDVTKFDAFGINLSELDPSTALMADKLELHIPENEKSKYQNKLTIITEAKLNQIYYQTTPSSAIREGYELKVHEEYPSLYRSVLRDYIKFQTYKSLQRTDLSTEDFKSFLATFHTNAIELADKNKKLSKQKPLLRELPRESQADTVLQAPFSSVPDERKIANKLALTHAYLDMWQQKKVQRPDTELFNNDYKEAQRIVKTNIKDINSEEYQDFIKTIDKINGTLRDAAKEKQFRAALAKAVDTTRTLNDWATNWAANCTTDNTGCFNLNEPWVQDSMKRLGIKKEDIAESHQKLRNNKYAFKVTSNVVGNPAGEVAAKCPSNEIVQTYEELIGSNANLKYIHSQLSKGFPIPVEKFPDRINGRQRIFNPGDQNNCLIHSWLGVTTNWNKQKIIQESEEIRGKVIERMSARLQLLETEIITPDMRKKREVVMKNLSRSDTLSEEESLIFLSEEESLLFHEEEALKDKIPKMRKGDMLEQGGFEGKHLIDYLVEERKLIDLDRGLLVYSFNNGRINCVERMPRSPEAELPLYAFFLQQDAHFEAMSEPKDTELVKFGILKNRFKLYMKDNEVALRQTAGVKGMQQLQFNELIENVEKLSQYDENKYELIVSCNRQLEKIDKAMPPKLRESCDEWVKKAKALREKVMELNKKYGEFYDLNKIRKALETYAKDDGHIPPSELGLFREHFYKFSDSIKKAGVVLKDDGENIKALSKLCREMTEYQKILDSYRECYRTEGLVKQVNMNWVDDENQLAVGGLIDNKALNALQFAGVSVVVDVRAKECDDEKVLEEHGIKLLHLPIDEFEPAKNIKELKSIADQVKKLLDEGKYVLIHCREGRGRSPLVAGCVQVLREIEDYKDKIYDRRPGSYLKDEQALQLEEFARLYGKKPQEEHNV